MSLVEKVMPRIEFVDEAEYAKLQAESEIANSHPRRFQSLRYEEKTKRLSLGLLRGLELALPISEVTELANVPAHKLKELRLSQSGEVIVLSSEDIHIDTGGLLRDMVALLPREIIAAQFAAMGGARTSVAKKIASAANGRLGGRPKKSDAVS